MLKFLFVFLLLLSRLNALDIDPDTLEKIIQADPQAKPERIILAKYYIDKGEETKALLLANEVLKLDPKNRYALQLKKKIEKINYNNTILREASLQKPITTEAAQKRLESYYNANNYQFFSNLYQALLDEKVALTDPYHLKAAYIYLWDTHYKQSQKALQRVKERNSIDKLKIEAAICYYQGDYKCARSLYKKLYETSYKLEYAVKLINSNIYLGQTEKAKRLTSYLLRKHPHNEALEAIEKKLQKSEDELFAKSYNAYKQNPNETTLQNYVTTLYSHAKKQKALDILQNYNQKHPSKQTLLLEAKYRMWEGENQKAMQILHNNAINSDLEAKFMLGELYSWNQNFTQAKSNLNEVITKSKDPKLLYRANKALAYLYKWEGKKEDSKDLFEQLQQKNPQDNEVKEALMELNNDYGDLIHLYKKRVADSKDLKETKRLAELYSLAKQKSAAIATYKKYLQKNPNDLEATKALALLLIENKDYYQGFGYLEYYNAEKQSAASNLLLAKNYYWQGFAQEALDVLNKFLKQHPENQDFLHLKAKILKVAPRFTKNNRGGNTQQYFENLGKKQLYLADTLYFNTHYKASLKYYNDYLQTHPDDSNARYRYAFALENAKEYAQAEGEFALLLYSKDNQQTRYHYAYNLMKNRKFKAAESEFKKLKKQSYKILPPDLQNFLAQWKRAWQSQDFSKYAGYYAKKIRNNHAWALKKQFIFKNAKFISVGIYDALYKKIGENRYIIRFYQEYATDKTKDKGYKQLTIACKKEMQECSIVDEKWSAGNYTKEQNLLPNIENNLKQIEYEKLHPQAYIDLKKKTLLSKKKSIQNVIMI